MCRSLTALLLCVLLCATPVVAADQKPVTDSIPAQILPDSRQQAIADYWSTLHPEDLEPYQTIPASTPEEEDRLALPSVVAPYAIGALDSDYLNAGLRYLNFVRWLTGLQQVTLSDHLCVQAQYGAVLLAANDLLTHSPEKPGDMEASFYRMGVNACAAGNLSMRYGFSTAGLLANALQGHMDEDSALNRLTLGHRRWLLNPKLGKVGFGLAASLSEKQYIVVPVTDDSGTGRVPDHLAWPSAGQFPNNVFAPGTPWSVSLDSKAYQVPDETQLFVTITRQRDGKLFTPTLLDGQAQLSRDGCYFLVSTDDYGSGICISFSIGKTQLGEPSYLGDYTVCIDGLMTKKGEQTQLEYTVRFFDAEQISQPSAWAMDEVTQAAQLSLIPEVLTDFYQQPITRLEYCLLTMQLLREKTGLTTEQLVKQYALPDQAPTFSDCTHPEVLAAAAIGAVYGPGDGTFRPEGLISRQDAAVMLMQAAVAVGASIQPQQGLLYADGDQIAPYAQTAVQWVSTIRDGVSFKPVMNGVGSGKFDPLGNYTREQAMLTALRLFRS